MDKNNRFSGDSNVQPRFPEWPSGWLMLLFDPYLLPDDAILLKRILDQVQRMTADLTIAAIANDAREQTRNTIDLKNLNSN